MSSACMCVHTYALNAQNAIQRARGRMRGRLRARRERASTSCHCMYAYLRACMNAFIESLFERVCVRVRA
jgi:hypothetical protein